MKLKKIDPMTVGCSYCGASAGHACVVTLAPEVGPLSITWNHRARAATVGA